MVTFYGTNNVHDTFGSRPDRFITPLMVPKRYAPRNTIESQIFLLVLPLTVPGLWVQIA